MSAADIDIEAQPVPLPDDHDEYDEYDPADLARIEAEALDAWDEEERR